MNNTPQQPPSQPNESPLDSANLPLVEALFIALNAQRGIRQSPATAAIKPASYAEVLHYVLGHDCIDAGQVADLINQYLPTRRLYLQLLQQYGQAWAPCEAHAQDSAVVEQRLGQGFHIRLTTAKGRPSQQYVTLTIDEHHPIAADKPLLLHLSNEHLQGRITFPVPIDRCSQLIMNKNDPNLLLLLNLDVALTLV